MSFDVHEDLFPDGDLDEDAAERYAEEICTRFAEAPESAPLADAGGWVGLMLQYATGYVGATPATMTAEDLEEILFDIFPRKVSCAPEDAEGIVRELDAFFAYVGREFALPHATACRGVLAGNAISRLRRELANPANYGMAKSFFMAGRAAGYDMTSEAGMASWTKAVNQGVVAPRIARRAPSGEERIRDRNRRKRDRKKARKRR